MAEFGIVLVALTFVAVPLALLLYLFGRTIRVPRGGTSRPDRSS